MSIELDRMNARLDRLEHENATTATDNSHLALRLQQSEDRYRQAEDRYRHSQRRLRVQMGLALVAVVGAILVSPANRAALAQGYGVTLATLNTRLSVVEAKTQFQSADSVAKSTLFSGCNVLVNDGGGSTDTLVTNSAGEGLGNLTIGYNATEHKDNINGQIVLQDIRTGSHNLIVGDKNNYSSYGGLIGGLNNTISGTYASVSGGYANKASGSFASVSGGGGNAAISKTSSVTGGINCTASGTAATVSGGSALTQSSESGWSGGSYHSP